MIKGVSDVGQAGGPCPRMHRQDTCEGAGQVCDARTRSPGWVWGLMLGSKTQRVPFLRSAPGAPACSGWSRFSPLTKACLLFLFSLLFCQRVGCPRRSGAQGKYPPRPPIPPARSRSQGLGPSPWLAEPASPQVPAEAAGRPWWLGQRK